MNFFYSIKALKEMLMDNLRSGPGYLKMFLVANHLIWLNQLKPKHTGPFVLGLSSVTLLHSMCLALLSFHKEITPPEKADNMKSSTFKKRLKVHLFVNPGKLTEAIGFYEKCFGAVEKENFISPRCVELFLAGITLVISEGEKGHLSETQPMLQVTIDEVKAFALKHCDNVVDCSGSISHQERARRIHSKIRDPYGYVWALSQPENFCKLCYCSPPVHLFDSLCTHSKTLSWIKQVSLTSASAQVSAFSTSLETKFEKFVKTCNDHILNRSQDFQDKVYHGFPSLMDFMINVYRFMVVIRWAHLIIRFETIGIEKEFDDASERLSNVLLRVHGRLDYGRHLDLDHSPLDLWKIGVESAVKLLRSILAKIGVKEGMIGSINEELLHWNSLLG